MPLPPVNHSLGTPFVELPSVDSTNNYALAQIHANLAQPGACYFAGEQTAGKGQRGKSWASERGANILLSVVVQPGFLQLFQQFYLNACVAVATHEFLGTYAENDLAIKWPNDLYWKDRKLGGILIENVISELRSSGSAAAAVPDLPAEKDQRGLGRPASNWKWAVIGIGININQTNFGPGLRTALSLKQITGQHFKPVELAKGLCTVLDRYYNQLKTGGFAGILDRYNKLLYKKNETVTFKRGTRRFNATVKSVNGNGQLIIHHAIEEKIGFGEADWIVGSP